MRAISALFIGLLVITIVSSQDAPKRTVYPAGDNYLKISPAHPGRYLTSSFLLDKKSKYDSMVANSEFAPVGATSNPSKKMDGRFVISAINSSSYNSTFIWSSPYASDCLPQPFDTPRRRSLPSMSSSYVQDDRLIYPTVDGWVQSGQPTSAKNPWEYIYSPGQCWRESSDGPYDRCVLNIALVESQQNCAYNILVTFLVHRGTLETSMAWFQIPATMCGYYQFNGWGKASIRFIPSANTSTNKALKNIVVGEYRSLIASRIPTRHISELPGFLPEWTERSNPMYNYSDHSDCSPVESGYGHIFTLYGVMHNDGKFYSSPSFTNAGNHPYPEWVVYPGYSFTKSFFGTTMAGAMDRQFGCTFPPTPHSTDYRHCIYSLKVKDWIPQASHIWSNITVQHLLDMSVNIYETLDYGVDEGTATHNQAFFYTYPYLDKLNRTLNGFPHHPEVEPGTIFNYNSGHFTLLASIYDEVTTTMSGYRAADFYREYICKPLKLSEMHCNIRVTEDIDAKPFGSYGTYYYADDFAKWSKFWTFSGGRVDGNFVINPDYYQKTMQLDASEVGVDTLRSADPKSTCYPVGSRVVPIPGQRFHNGWWSDKSVGAGFSNFETPCGNERTVFASGYGGLRMNIQPGTTNRNGFAYLQVNDNYDYVNQRALSFLMNSISCSTGMNA